MGGSERERPKQGRWKDRGEREKLSRSRRKGARCSQKCVERQMWWKRRYSIHVTQGSLQQRERIEQGKGEAQARHKLCWNGSHSTPPAGMFVLPSKNVL